MHVLMIDPTYYHQGRLVKLRRVGYFPITLPRLAALVPAGHRITLLHEKVEAVDPAVPCELAMFTTMGSNLVRAEELSAAFRARGVKTVVGGYSVYPYLDRCRSAFDAAVVGEGEGLMPRLLADAAAGRLQSVYENLAPPLDEVPEPRYDLVSPSLIGDIVPVEASRGCPNHCDFCGISSFTPGGQRRRPVAQVLRDLAGARRHWGRHLVYFTDPNFTADLAYTKALLTAMRGWGGYWLASVDVRALADDDFLALARQTGCFCLQVGFESIAPAALRQVNKHFTAATDSAGLALRARRAGIPLAALLMVGFDGEDPGIFARTAEFGERQKLPLLVSHIMMPIPGTPLYRRLQAAGRLLDTDLIEADGLHLYHRPDGMSIDTFMRGFWRMNRRLVSLRSIVRRFLHLDVLRNPVAWLILLVTNLRLARRVVRERLPMGMYE